MIGYKPFVYPGIGVERAYAKSNEPALAVAEPESLPEVEVVGAAQPYPWGSFTDLCCSPLLSLLLEAPV